MKLPCYNGEEMPEAYLIQEQLATQLVWREMAVQVALALVGKALQPTNGYTGKPLEAHTAAPLGSAPLTTTPVEEGSRELQGIHCRSLTVSTLGVPQL